MNIVVVGFVIIVVVVTCVGGSELGARTGAALLFLLQRGVLLVLLLVLVLDDCLALGPLPPIFSWILCPAFFVFSFFFMLLFVLRDEISSAIWVPLLLGQVVLAAVCLSFRSPQGRRRRGCRC